MKDERQITDTMLLYEKDGLITSFDAVVTSIADDNSREMYVVLDATAFFPGGGGQQADTGVLIRKNGEKVNVTDVRSHEGCVRHYIDKKLEPGETVTGHIDASLRSRRMQNHGAEHLLCGIIHEKFGYDNVGFHMSDNEVVFDIDGMLDAEDIRLVEECANEVIYKNVPITISFPTPEEAQGLEYRSKLDTYENIRLVTIEGYDACACCAPHVQSTGQLGIVKILDYMPHRGGMRLFMAAGYDAYNDYASLCRSNRIIMDVLSAKRDKTAEYVIGLQDRYNAAKENISELQGMLTAAVAANKLAEIKSREPDAGGPEVIWENRLDMTGLRKLVNECTKACDRIVCAFREEEKGYRYIFSVGDGRSADLKGFTDRFNGECMGSGGGSDIMTQGSSKADRSVIEDYMRRMDKNSG